MNLFLVENPINYVNSLELVEYKCLKIKACDLIIVTKNKENYNQLLTMIDYKLWNSVLFVFESKFDGDVGLLDYVKAFRRLKAKLSVNYFDLVVSGYYKHKVNNYILCNIEYGNYYLVDDGNMTVFSNAERGIKQSISPIELGGTLRSKLGILLLTLFVNFKRQDIVCVNFFSSHPIKTHNKDILHVNHYNRLLNLSIEMPMDTEIVMFLGAPLVEKGVVTSSVAAAMYDGISSLYSGKEILYFPHRYESDSSLKNLESKYSFKVVRSDIPFEFYISSTPSFLPGMIVGFYSSAFSNLVTFLPKAVALESLYINAADILDIPKGIMIEEIYRAYNARDGVTVVKGFYSS